MIFGNLDYLVKVTYVIFKTPCKQITLIVLLVSLYDLYFCAITVKLATYYNPEYHLARILYWLDFSGTRRWVYDFKIQFFVMFIQPCIIFIL